mmetsp:Transcript_19745/g.35718  ORF Transcript_19745/g.35718 Transcript_19745/m.35718 type:complete len:219 (+) Transcript_19745:583-1239(+)
MSPPLPQMPARDETSEMKNMVEKAMNATLQQRPQRESCDLAPCAEPALSLIGRDGGICICAASSTAALSSGFALIACTILHFQPACGTTVPAASSTAALSSGCSWRVSSTRFILHVRRRWAQRVQRQSETMKRTKRPPAWCGWWLWWKSSPSSKSISISSVLLLISRKMASVCAMACWHPTESDSRDSRRHMSASREPKPSGPPHLWGRPSPSPWWSW